MVIKKGWVEQQFERIYLEDKLKEEEIIEEGKFLDNQKRLIRNEYMREYNQRPYVKAKRKEYYRRRKKEKNDKENLYQFTHTRKGKEHKLTLYRLD